jgi:hypothetical protein
MPFMESIILMVLWMSFVEHSSHHGAGAQVIIDKFIEDHSDIASKITPETNTTGGALNDAATQYTGKASPPEEGVSSVPESAVTSEKLQECLHSFSSTRNAQECSVCSIRCYWR